MRHHRPAHKRLTHADSERVIRERLDTLAAWLVGAIIGLIMVVALLFMSGAWK